MSGPRLRVGVIGAGNIATIAQLPTLVQRDDVDLAALVSRREDPGNLVRRWGFGAAYRSVGDMVASQDLDAVFVLTPRAEPSSYAWTMTSTCSAKNPWPRPPRKRNAWRTSPRSAAGS
jgi:hypothetical protein